MKLSIYIFVNVFKLLRGSEKFPFKTMAEFKAKCNFNNKMLIQQHALFFTCSTAVTSRPRDFPYATALHRDEKTPTTVDVADVKLHSKLKEQWWDENGPMKALHAFNLLR